jgi:hypothetical protein
MDPSNRNSVSHTHKKEYPFDLYNIEEENVSANGSHIESRIDEIKVDVLMEPSSILESKLEIGEISKIDISTDERNSNVKNKFNSQANIKRGTESSNYYDNQTENNKEDENGSGSGSGSGSDTSSSEEEIDPNDKNDVRNYSINNGLVQFVRGNKQLERTKTGLSFYEGRPKNEEEILKLECPLYRVGRSTIVTNAHSRKVSLQPGNRTSKHGSIMNNSSATLKRTKTSIDIGVQKPHAAKSNL